MTKRYICQFCARSFSRSEHKLRHERSHTREKPFQCSICKNGFVRRDLLQRHLRTVHGLVLKHNIDDNISTKDELLKSPTGASDSGPVNLQLSAIPNSPNEAESTEDSSALIAEKTITSLLTLSNKFGYLDLKLNCSVGKYIIAFGSCKKWQANLPSINLSKLQGLSDTDEMLYLIICLGACRMNEFDDASLMFNRSWDIMIEKISDSKINYNSGPSFNKFVNHLIILGHVYLHYFVDFFNSPSQTSQQLCKKIAIPIDVLFDYLNNIISTYLTNVENEASKDTHKSPSPPNTSVHDANSFYWHAYLLLSEYSFVYNKSPSSLHLYLLNKPLPDEFSETQGSFEETLGQMINNLSLISSSFPNFVNHNNLSLKEKAIIAGLMNELQMVKFNEINKLNKNVILQQGLFKDNKNFLHNAIILANKNFNVSGKPTSQFDEEFVQLLSVVKRRLLLNCPLKFTDLLMNYLVIPKSDSNWILLALTLKEFLFETESLINDKNFLNSDKPIIEFDLSKLINVIHTDGNSPAPSTELTDEEVYKNLHQFMNTPFNGDFIVNNNLGITMLPCLLLSLVFDEEGLVDNRKLLNLPENKLVMVEFIMGNFLVLIRILNFFKKKYFMDVSIGKNWPRTEQTQDYPANESNNSDEDDPSIDNEEESIILAVIFFVINELGCNHNEKPAPTGGRRRANSISIGEFNNNNDKLKKLINSPKDSKSNSNKQEHSIKSQLASDTKFQFIVRNIQICFGRWLKLFTNRYHQIDRFLRILNKVLEDDIYSKASDKTSANGSYNLEVFNLISAQQPQSIDHQQYAVQNLRYNGASGLAINDPLYLHHHSTDYISQHKFPGYTSLHFQRSLSPTASSSILPNKDDDRVMLPPLSRNSRQLPNPLRSPYTDPRPATGATEGLSDLLHAASNGPDYEKR
ncbi:hypothetical protein OGAPHI_003719 [Ogataea philodendri]|uniref:C2H2-type domain-containing protein n=1 Tax=Ogataea philodendri TaxID=1378263 RepID=A0A9P8P4U9_9ASCO|nr:uncharacterized protein OGAPHI_003719 [Ogataea philodendri]KAH3665533.1 hypothetical protein OGAPHI_003719 [Ogataea philodendri]